MKKRVVEQFSFVGGVIFFLDVFLALMIIVTASTLLKTQFGVMAIVFGFFMLTLTTVLKIMRKW
jgi:hypothetical protein